jgi:DNA-directed RNA polymerase beta subunit
MSGPFHEGNNPFRSGTRPRQPGVFARPYSNIPPLDTPPPPDTRAFDDTKSIRKLTDEMVLDRIGTIAPIQDQKYTLSIHDVAFEDEDEFTPEDEKKAILEGRTLARRVRGTFKWIDNRTGEPIETARKTLAAVPYMTDAGVYILNGNEVGLVNQPRLKPGVYARRMANGELESRIQAMPGKGVSSSIRMDPESGKLVWRIGQANVPLYQALLGLGAKREQISEAWGEPLVRMNEVARGASTPVDAMARLFDTQGLVRNKATVVDKVQAVKDAVANIGLDPEVTKRSLGMPHGTVSPELLIRAAAKLVAINKGEAEPDDREDPANVVVYGPEDLIAERVSKGVTDLKRAFKNVARGKADFLRRLPSGAFTRHVQGPLFDSGLQRVLSGVNPVEKLDQLTGYSRLGYGGIASTDSIPRESRNVHPGQLNVFDVLKTSESTAAGVQGGMSSSAYKTRDGNVVSPYYDTKDKKWVWLTPSQTHDQVIGFKDSWDEGEPYVFARTGKTTDVFDRDKVRYVYPDFDRLMNQVSQLVPDKPGVKGQRAVMGLRMTTQAMPLANPEAPLVRSADPERPGISRESTIGMKAGAVRAEQGGTVIGVGEDFVKVRNDDGTTQNIALRRWHPHNRKSVAGETEILIRRPSGAIFQGPIALYEFEEGDETLAIDPVTLESGWFRVLAKTWHLADRSRMVTTTLANGMSVRTTDDHALIVLSEEEAAEGQEVVDAGIEAVQAV